MIANNIVSLVNTRHYRGISSFDTPHVVNLAWVYDLPFGRGRPLVKKIAGGWSLGGRYYYTAGNPLSISDSNGRLIRLRNAARSGAMEQRLGDQVNRPNYKNKLGLPIFLTRA